MVKNQIRTNYLNLRKRFSQYQLQIFDLVIYKELIKYLNNNPEIKTIVFYWSINNEVNLKKFYYYCKNLNFKCLFPVPYKTKHNSLVFLFQEIEYNLFQHKTDILYPSKIRDKDKNFHEDEIDLILCPLIAFNKFNHRIGYGFGAYDKILKKQMKKNNKLKVIGLGYNFQFTNEKFHDKNDFKLNSVITN